MIEEILIPLVVYTVASHYIATVFGWNCFTRVCSTVNAVLCSYLLVTTYYTRSWNELLEFSNVGESWERQILFIMVGYLIVDGSFQIPFAIYEPTLHNLLGVIHHSVGATALYRIAFSNYGYALGLYFAGTEISTPFLNISWYLLKRGIYPRLFKISGLLLYIVFFFSRIASIPLLLYYLWWNMAPLINLGLVDIILGYGGAFCITSLNIVWFVQLTKIVYK